MNRKILLMLAVIGILTASAASANALLDGDYYKEVTVTVGSGTLTDYPIPLNVTYDSDMNADFTDVKFRNNCSDDAVLLDYWLKERINSTWAYYWVEVDTINTTICMRYGNVSGLYTGDASDVFTMFDGAESGVGGWTENAGTWGSSGTLTQSSGQVKTGSYSFYLSSTGSEGHYYAGIPDMTDDSYAIMFDYYIADDAKSQVIYYPDIEGMLNYNDVTAQLVSDPIGGYFKGRNGAGDSNLVEALQDQWYTIEVSDLDFSNYENDYVFDTVIEGDDWGFRNNKAGLKAIEWVASGATGSDSYMDNLIVRKWNNPEPESSIGAEQSGSGNTVPSVTINEPANTTFYTTSIQLNFTGTDAEDLNLSAAVYIDGALNDTYEVDNATDEIIDFVLTGGQHYFMVNVTDDGGASADTTVYFYVYMGINVSAYDSSDNSSLTNWEIYVNNDTTNYHDTGLTNPSNIEWSDLPTGSVNITIDDGSSSLYYFNETQAWNINSSDYSQLDLYLDPKPSNSFSFISSPAWTVAENAAVTITCTATEGTATLYKDSVVVSSPYEATMSFGMYNFTCTVAETDNYAPYTETKWLTVQSGGFGCTDTNTYAFNKNITVAGEWINIDFTDLVSSNKVKSDLSDVYITADFEVTTYKNTSGSSSYIVANFSNNTEIEVYFGNYIVNYTHNETATVANSTNMSGYSEINSYITASLIDEISGTYLLPPDANNSMTIYCSGGASTFDVYDTQFVVATTEEADSIRFTVQYSAAELYYRDYVIDAPIENQPIYLVDANDYQVVRQIYKLRDLTGEFVPSYFIVDKYMEGDLVTITELLFDAENKAIAFLTNGHKYLIFLDNGVAVRGVGNIYVDSADLEKTITVGGVDAYNMTNANVTLNVTHTDTAILLYWYDASGQTNQVDLWVYNYTNRSHLLYYGAAASNDVLLSYVVPNSSATYWVEYEIHSDYYGNETVGGGMAMVFSYVMPAVSFPLLALLTAMGAQLPTLWFMLFFVLPMPLFFTSRTVGVGALVMVGTAAIMLYWQQLNIYAPLLGLGLFMVVLIEVNARRKRERVR